MDDHDEVQQTLKARLASCLERFDDVVSELVEVHGFSKEEVVDRVAKTADAERDEQEASESTG